VCLSPRAGLDAVAKRRNPFPCRKSNLGRRARGLVTILTELPRLPGSNSGCLYVLAHNLLRRTEENHERSESGYDDSTFRHSIPLPQVSFLPASFRGNLLLEVEPWFAMF